MFGMFLIISIAILMSVWFGFSMGHDYAKYKTEIRILNGTAQMRLETQADNND